MIPSLTAVAAPTGLEQLGSLGRAAAPQPVGATFASMLADGIDSVDRKVTAASTLARSFALDDSIPVHQVTFALEQAHLSLELMMQVRARLVEGFQQIMGMQL